MNEHLLKRPRRLRQNAVIRELVRETRLVPGQLVYPLFLVRGTGQRQEVPGIPGIERYSVDESLRLIEWAMGLGVKAFALFPKVEQDEKTKDGSSAIREDTLICKALRTLKAKVPEACLITDVALDPYSSDGHDGVVKDGEVANDESVDVLARMALVQAQAGADIVAPSDMMDGRVRAIRDTLDAHGCTNTVILSYAVKYASSFYGPFRSILQSAPVEGENIPSDKSTYQMDPANGIEALVEASLDIDENADILMVKPGLPYLDVIRRLSSQYCAPIAAYHVSGEYCMLRAAAEQGYLNYEAALRESLLCLARAGARMIFTYGALDYARLWRQEHTVG